jgi:hypothetical protein
MGFLFRLNSLEQSPTDHQSITNKSVFEHCHRSFSIRECKQKPIWYGVRAVSGKLPKEKLMKVNARLTAITLAILALTSAIAINANAQSGTVVAHPQKIEGGWLFNVVVPPGTPGPPSFLALDSFADGGGWSGHASTDSAANWSATFGSWKWSNGDVVITQVQFSQDASGVPTGLITIHKRMHFTSTDTLAGTSSVTFCAMDGTNCFTPPGRARITAARIKAAGPSAP